MTLTVTNATVPSVCGPGYEISVLTSLAGPFLLDDFYTVEVLLPPLTTNYFCGGSALSHSFSFSAITLGISDMISQGVLDQYVAPGTVVTLSLQLSHADFTSIDAGLSTGWTWDPVGGLYQVIARAAVSGSSAEVLAAVRRTFG